TALPDRLLAREVERRAIKTFLRQHVCARRPGSLYVSGAPGTGKTALLNRLLPDMQEELGGAQTIIINCMSLRSSQSIFQVVANKLFRREQLRCLGNNIPRQLARQLCSAGPMVLLVVDEMDQLDSQAQDVLYTVFEWPWLLNSRLVLIGIANALDLTDRILPRLQAHPRCKPQLLNFPPYTKEQIVAIVQDRLSQVPGEKVLDNSAVQFCAGKVSSLSGDARKALDVCRRAVEMVEMDVRCQTVLKPVAECKSQLQALISLPHISRVMSEVYGDRMKSSSGAEHAFPLQQKFLACSLLLLTRDSQVKEVTLGKLHEVYRKVCRKQQMCGVDQSECLSLCSLLEARGIVSIKRTREARLAKVVLKIEEKDLEHALQDKVLMGSILREGLP
uniref:Cell division control protein 6 homolog n=1 Tax=Callorhinchus milii TaxID=7868 RepID=A0A4W3HJN7_CALMI